MEIGAMEDENYRKRELDNSCPQSLGLKEVRGVNEMIPNAEAVKDPDHNEELPWSLEDAGYLGWNF